MSHLDTILITPATAPATRALIGLALGEVELSELAVPVDPHNIANGPRFNHITAEESLGLTHTDTDYF